MSRGSGRFGLRNTELLLLVYFAYTALLSQFLAIPPHITGRTLVVNLTVFTCYLLLAYWGRLRPGDVWSVVRDWLPLATVMLAYQQMGWFAPAEHTHELEQGWVVWDRVLLDDWGLREATELLGPLLPSLLELSYLLVYAVGPVGMSLLYLRGQRGRADQFLFVLVLGTILSYALFPYFPSEPPRAVFPGELFPTIDTVFRRLNWWVLGSGGIHTSVFPSAHVSSVFAGAFAMWMAMPRPRWIHRGMFVLACFIFWATIYGRYHYAVDSVAGVGVSLVALAVGCWVCRRSRWDTVAP